MKTIRVGRSRLYNARACSLVGREQILLEFVLGSTDVAAYFGPEPRHVVLSFETGPPEPKAEGTRGRVSRERSRELPPPERFPADFYTELVATETVEVDDPLAAAFQDRDRAARHEVLQRADERSSSLTTALDYVAGIVGLRVHSLLVATPITEQCYAYRDKGAPYAVSANLRLKVTGTHKWDVSDEGLTTTKSRMPEIRKAWMWEKAAGVLAWLLSAWAAEDPVLRFVSLFIPLECVIPKLPAAEKEAWYLKQRAVLALIDKHATTQSRGDLAKFVSSLRPPPPSLGIRFRKWAAEAALPGWRQDVANLGRFSKMRNLLVHAGKVGTKSRVMVGADHVWALEDIAERYVSLGLFGDANVYESPARRSTFAKAG